MTAPHATALYYQRTATREDRLCDQLIDIYLAEKKLGHPENPPPAPLLAQTGGGMTVVDPLQGTQTAIALNLAAFKQNISDFLSSDHAAVIVPGLAILTAVGLLYAFQSSPEPSPKWLPQPDYARRKQLEELDIQRYELTLRNPVIFPMGPLYRNAATPLLYRQRHAAPQN